ncbi:death-associated protein-like 1-A [Brienomyrus brachyistius]|uniref:death-associated protein-like 1-A n=1 Tax=Brienomyrus brachyistius TaxID=42636 RepID=UPI0020B1B3F6|nr:death-associated protein-like 1-A [Brienomyrus brachyistius]
MVQGLKPGVRGSAALKAGHPPAVMAGGKRVAKKTPEEASPPAKDVKRAVDKARSLPAPIRMQSVNLLLSGTLDKLAHDFPTAPVSVRHSRLMPAVAKPHSPKTFVIQQPRKC